MTTTFTESPTVTPTPTLGTPYTVHLAIYDSGGRLIRDLGDRAVVGLGSALQPSSAVFFMDGGQPLVLRDELGVYLGAWDGLHSDGGFAAPGAYRIQAHWSGAGVSVDAWTSVAVLPSGSLLARSLFVAPNPAGGAGSAFTQLRWTPDARSALVKARIYNIAGELVMQNAVDAGAGHMDWDLRSPQQLAVSDGVYVWNVEVLDPSGRTLDRKTLKLAILRR